MRSQNEADDRERMRALRERLETFRTTNTNTTNTQQEHLRRRGGEEELFHDDVVSVAICQKFAELAVRNQRLVRSASEAREIIDRLSAELNSFRDSCEQ